MGAFTGGAWLWEVGQMPGNTAPAAMVIALQCLQPLYHTGTPHILHVWLFLSVPLLLMEITGLAERRGKHYRFYFFHSCQRVSDRKLQGVKFMMMVSWREFSV